METRTLKLNCYISVSSEKKTFLVVNNSQMELCCCGYERSHTNKTIWQNQWIAEKIKQRNCKTTRFRGFRDYLIVLADKFLRLLHWHKLSECALY